ncbi:MAG TPA: polysaccharide pyruvyl transferase CsaB [Thermoanaerobaculia bacterium]|jgi:polysaccharide pyruvyl transferase CsaB
MPAGPRSILIAGYYGFGNAGDEAILAAMLRELRALRPDLELVVASGDPAATGARHGVRAISRDDLPAAIAAVRQSALVILGGGGLFQDYWSVPAETLLTVRQGGLLTYLSFPVLAALLGRPSMLYAAGVGPLATEEGRALTRLAFALCRRATVRDAGSLALLADLGAPVPAGGPVELAADPAFLLPPVAGAELAALLAELGLEPGERLTGVALRPWDFGVEPLVWEAEVRQALDLHLAETPGRLLFLPFAHEDEEVGRRMAARLARAERALVIRRPLDPEELAGLLGRCERVLAMRFHAVLFALAAGVPAVGLAYDQKVSALMADAGLADLALPSDRWRADEVAAALRRAAGPEVRERLAGFAKERRALARRSAVAALAALDEGEPERPEARRFLDELALAKVAAVLRLEGEREELRRLAAAAEAGLAAAEAGLAAARGELTQLRQDWEARGREIDAHRQQREVLLRETHDLDRRLSELERTLAYRIVSRFWRLMRRVFPEGSRRREVYRLGRRAGGRLLGGGGDAWKEGTGGAAAPGTAGAGEPAPDFRADLLHFEERVRAAGSPRVVAIFSGTQLLESEGQRPTQLALALARRGVPVVFVYWRWWESEWRPQDRLEEGILQIPIDVVTRRPEMLTGAFAGRERIALFEFPHPGFFETVSMASSAGWITVYDVIDDWEEFHRVGQAVWWDEELERHLIGACDAVFCINGSLQERVRGLGGEAERVGNGLKPGLGEVREPRPLVRGEVTVGYFGYLAAAWFDWELIAGAARRRPAWRFYLIGYGGSPEGVELPANVELLGRQPQEDLAAFAANWDVALVPFKPDRLAAGADPIKTYEYLAMGLPVVTTGVFSPSGGEAFVTRAEGVQDFLAAVEGAAAGGPEAAAARRAFAAGCTWDHRLAAMLDSIAEGRQRVAEKRALFRPSGGGEDRP